MAKKKSIEPPTIANLPPFPTLIGEGDWSGKVTLTAWKGFQSRCTAWRGLDSDNPSDGTAILRVESPRWDFMVPPTLEQMVAFHYLVKKQKENRTAIVEAVFAKYPEWRQQMSGCLPDDEFNEIMPIIKRASDLKQLMGLSIVHILKNDYDGGAYVGFEFGCTWEVEHGLGVMIHDDRIIDIGVATCSWDCHTAEKDCQTMTKKAKKKV